jgi:MFS family permease
MAFGAPVIGWLAGRLGKRPVLLTSVLIYSLAGMAGALAPDLWSLLASRLVLGMAAAGYVTVSVSLIGDYYAPVERDRLIGWYAVVGGGGSLVVLKAAGILTELGGWHAPFALFLSGIPLFLLGMFTIREKRAGGVVSTTEGIPAGGSDSIMGAWGIYVLITLLSISMYAITIQGTFLMNDEGITNPSIQSNILLLATVGSMVGAYVFRYFRPTLGFHLTLALTWGWLALGNIGFASTVNVYLLAAFAAASGMGSGFMQPLTQTAVLHIVSPAASARAMGLAIGCIFLGQFLHPFVLSPLRTAFGLQGAFFWVGGASLAAAVIAALWRLRVGFRAAPAR